MNLILLFLVVGALIGKQKGRNIEVMNSFELKFEVLDKSIIINQDYYNTKEQQCKLSFSSQRKLITYLYLYLQTNRFLLI